jgi:hypothetical protein
MIDAGYGLNAILIVMGAVPVIAGMLGFAGCWLGRPKGTSRIHPKSNP